MLAPARGAWAQGPWAHGLMGAHGPWAMGPGPMVPWALFFGPWALGPLFGRIPALLFPCVALLFPCVAPRGLAVGVDSDASVASELLGFLPHRTTARHRIGPGPPHLGPLTPLQTVT